MSSLTRLTKASLVILSLRFLDAEDVIPPSSWELLTLRESTPHPPAYLWPSKPALTLSCFWVLDPLTLHLSSLTQMESDETLEAEVTRIFSEFGTVFVKIRRDQKNMPFAFCQFTVCMVADDRGLACLPLDWTD